RYRRFPSSLPIRCARSSRACSATCSSSAYPSRSPSGATRGSSCQGIGGSPGGQVQAFSRVGSIRRSKSFGRQGSGLVEVGRLVHWSEKFWGRRPPFGHLSAATHWISRNRRGIRETAAVLRKPPLIF